MKSTVFADPVLLLKKRLQSDTVTIRPANIKQKSNIATSVSENVIQIPTQSTEYFPPVLSSRIHK